MPYAARSILSIDASPFGRSLGLIPAIRSLRSVYPETFLVAAAATGTCQLLSAVRLVDDVIDLGVIKHAETRHTGALKRFVSLARRARQHGFDLVLDFTPRLETQIVSRLLVRGRTLTPARLPRVLEFLVALSQPSESAPGLRADDYESVLRQAGVERVESDLQIEPSPEEDERFERLLVHSGSRGGELLALLYASDPENRQGWPVRAFGEIGARLSNNFGARIIAADEPAARAFTDAVSQYLPHGWIRLASPSAPALVAAMARSSIVVTDDPGIARMASGLGAPVVEVSDARGGFTAASGYHRVVSGQSRAHVPPDAVYQSACEVIQASRSASLFERP